MNNKIALLTGASGVIGSAIAKVLAENGYHLILHYNKHFEKVIQLKEQTESLGSKVALIQADLSHPEGIEKLFYEINEGEITPSVLINAAGVSHYGLIQDVSMEQWQFVTNTNIMSTYFCSQRVIPYMLKNQYGRIINISSVWGNVGAANEVLYSLTKGAVNIFTKALAKELAPSGITVNAIAPGIVMSQMMESFSEEEIRNLKDELPMKRFAKPEEIAQGVLFLLNPNSSYITGQILSIDGGWT